MRHILSNEENELIFESQNGYSTILNLLKNPIYANDQIIAGKLHNEPHRLKITTDIEISI